VNVTFLSVLAVHVLVAVADVCSLRGC